MRRLSPLVVCTLLLLLLPDSPVRGQDDTLGAPTISSVIVGDTSFTIKWSEPSVTGTAAITSYDLRHIASAAPDKSDTYWTVVEGVWSDSDLVYVLPGLVNGTGHDVQIRAVAGATDGPWSATSSGTPTDFGGSTGTAENLTPNTPIGGAISKRREVDYLRVRLTRRMDLVAYTTGDLDTVGTLFNSRGEEVYRNDDARLGHGTYNFLVGGTLPAGTYYLRVAGYGYSTGSYTLHVRTGTDTTATTTAEAIEPDGIAFGVIASDTDADFYKLDLSEATDLIIRSEGRPYDTQGEVLDANGMSTASGDIGYLAPNWSQFLIRTRLASGVHYIKVKGAPGDHGPYFLHVEKVAEPGSNVAGAVPMTIGRAVGGRIDPATDADYFRFELADDTYLLLRGSSKGVNIKGELLDSGGSPLTTSVGEEVFQTGGPWGLLLNDALDAGTYHLKVTSSDGSRTGSYTILVLVEAQDNTAYNTFRTQCKQVVTGYSDPLYGCQWHLNNRGRSGGTAGEDINAEDVWDTYLGTGIPIAIVDDTMEYEHEDLVDNLNQRRSRDYRQGDSYVSYSSHSTRVAGVAAARGNAKGGRGVAPRATLYSYNLLDAFTAANLADSMTRNLATTGVSNNSWGFPDGPRVDPAPRLWELAVDQGVTNGYGGKGIFYAWAAGNGARAGDNSNLEGYANYYAVTAVCSVNDRGLRSNYSEVGANLWVCAPSSDRTQGRQGIVTTSPRSSYVNNFGGTSAASPAVSGVAALLREADADLTWRDLKLILAASARKNDPTDSGWEEGAVKYGSATEKYNFNHEYGFGVVDAKAAVDLVADWDPLPPMIKTDRTLQVRDTIIPDRNTITSRITIDSPVEFIEFVQIDTRFEAPSFRNLEVKLRSPAGGESVLSVPNSRCSSTSCPLNGWFRFGSARHLGEDPDGTWILEISDDILGDTNSKLKAWGLTFYGHRSTPGPPSIDSVSQGSSSLTVAWTAPTYEGSSDVTSYDVRYIRSDAGDKSDANWTVVDPAWTSGARRYTISSLSTGIGYDVQVRGVNASGDGAWSATKTGTVGATNSPPAFTEGISATRSVRENSAVGVNVGSPVRATDANRDTLTYTLSGTGSNLFAIDSRTGQITVGSATGLDYETAVSHRLTVSVHDGKSPTGQASTVVDDTIAVTVSVSDVNEPLTISGRTALTHSERYSTYVTFFKVEDPEQGVIKWSLAGADRDDFTINSRGTLYFSRERPDYEEPTDSNQDNIYEVTVRASDGTNTVSLDVTVTVADRNERPELSGASSVAYAENGTGPVATYTADDPENDELTWTLTGSDADDFAISDSGELTFLVPPDHEAPSDYSNEVDGVHSDNVYQVTVNADDGTFEDSLAVVVTVTNVDEPGKLKVSSPHPQKGTPLQATATDPDGNISKITWKWERSSNGSSWSTIGDATSGTYNPGDEDLDKYLRASVTYTDQHGPGKALSITSATKTQAEPAGNTAPTFSSTPVTLTVAENSASGRNIGTPVVATDTQGDPVAYSISETDAALFAIEELTGQLKTKTPLDYENLDHKSLTVMVTATDPSLASNTTSVTINVTNVNEAPKISGQFRVFYLENGTDEVHAYDDGDPDGDAVTWTVTGTDASDFNINSSGELAFDGAPDYEDPTDSNKDNTYTVTIRAADTDFSDSKEVTVTVSNVDEPPVVTGPAAVAHTENQASLTVADFDAEDPEGDPIFWRIDGTDLADFTIDGDGTVVFKQRPDFENPHDADLGNDYEIEVNAFTDRWSSTLHPVTISVGNQDEPGEVTLGSAQPQVNAVLQAELTDPDQGLSSFTWTWERSSDKTTWTTIANQASDTYTPATGDLNQYLRATASYTDGEGSGKTANAISELAVEEAPVTNEAPEFPPAETGSRSVAESAGKGENIGSPVKATDADADDVLTYSLGGSDASSFAIEELTGQLKIKSPLDYEDRSRYFVTVTATDPSQESATVSVTINVVDINEAPEVTGDTNIGYDENDTSTVADYTADDPEGAEITWGLSGPDSSDFSINTQGQLTFRTAPNFEAPTASNGTNTYRISVLGSDGHNVASLEIAVAVANQDEDGIVTLSSRQPKTDSPLTGTLRDPDGGVTNARWVWERSPNRSTWSPVTGAVLSTYTPVAADIGYYLRVAVSYDDAQGTAKSAQEESANQVQRGRTTNEPPAFPEDETGRRNIAEGTDPATDIGDPVAATDPDADDVLTYRLDGPDADDFELVASSGQLRTKSTLDYESRNRYEMQVIATDAFNASVSIPVTVAVTNADEAGEVVLSSVPPGLAVSSAPAVRNTAPSNIPLATPPRVGTPFTAAVRDPDGTVSGATWQWYRTSIRTDPGDPIDGARSSTYTPVDSDENIFLRAVASYTDPQGPGKTADGVSKAVEAAPPFRLSVSRSHISEGGTSTLTVATRTGDPVAQAATIELFFGGTAGEDVDYRVDTHSITIDIGDTSGTAAITALRDTSSEPPETITIAALYEGELVGSATVTIRGSGVTPTRPTGPGPGPGTGSGSGAGSGFSGGGGGGPEPLPPGSNLPPEFTEGSRALRGVAENTPAGVNIGSPVEASDPDEDPLTYRLAGTDAGAFDIDPSSGQLLTRAGLDYEIRSTYAVTVEVRDGKNSQGELDRRRDDAIRVTITVIDQDDEGWVTLSAPTPRVGQPIDAALTDPDTGVTDLAWKWEASPDGSTWALVNGASVATYIPTAEDEHHYLRATASYSDSFGPDQTATTTSATAVVVGHATTFTDVTEESVHTPAIEALAEQGTLIDTECGREMFCPTQPLQRWVMAIWLIRILSDPPRTGGESRFGDVPDGQWWIRYVEELATRQITLGCSANPPEYCPNGSVTRAQMASFLVRALQLPPAGAGAGFTDTVGNTHAANIDTLAAAGITVGCSTEPLRYCPGQPVTRGQMATFLHRAFTLEG